MTSLLKLNISGLRNLEQLSLVPDPQLNVLHGDNGSGKTSFLEGVHLLGTARSFRGSHARPLIQTGCNECVVFGQLDSGVGVGVRKFHPDGQEIMLGGKKAESSAELARALPLQLLNADTFAILEGGPAMRRKFVDWGVFHVEHGFLANWRQVQKSLQQRNALLKRGAPLEELSPWSQQLARFGEYVDGARKAYVDQLLPVLQEVLALLLPAVEVSLQYVRGWDDSLTLAEALAGVRGRDQRQGHTTVGPHRADVRMCVGRHPAPDVLSRGQQKLLVGALKLAQGMLLEKETGRKCVYLIDDLPAELDKANRVRFGQFLAGLNCQVFMTCVEEEALAGCWPPDRDRKVFHVKHGKIT